MENQEVDDPIVKSPQVEKLQEQFLNLQLEWESYKQSHSKARRRSCSSSSSITLAKTVDQLLDYSPRHLIYSLQHTMPASDGDYWSVRTNALAVEEMRRDRRAAIEAGKLKGRRLFGDQDEQTDEEEIESGESKEIEVCFQDSISSITSSSLCGEKMKTEEKLVSVEKEKVVKTKGANRVRCFVMIMLVICIAALIFAMCSVGDLHGYGNECYEPFLVPT